MATVISITNDKAAEIANASIVAGEINPANGHLLLTTAGGDQFDAGKVVPDAAPIDNWPIGSVFMNLSPANPATLLGGGTWTRWGKGRVPVGLDELQTEFDTPEEIGGEKKHTLAANEMPSHSHGSNTGGQSADHYHGITINQDGNHNHGYTAQALASNVTGGSASRYVGRVASNTGDAGTHSHTASVGGVSANHNHSISAQGGGEAHNILQPYITCYMWKRTA